jgi:hypothetical protein
MLVKRGNIIIIIRQEKENDKGREGDKGRYIIIINKDNK